MYRGLLSPQRAAGRTVAQEQRVLPVLRLPASAASARNAIRHQHVRPCAAAVGGLSRFTRGTGAGGAGYGAGYNQSQFDSLDTIELERLHGALKSAYSWLDIKASLTDYEGMMVDEESVVCALTRLSAIYSHLGPAEKEEVRGSGLVQRLAAMAERRLPALSPKQLAEGLDALARLEFRAPPSFLKAAKKHAADNLDAFAPAQLPLLVVAFAALGQEPGAALLGSLSQALAAQQLDISPDQLATTLVALAGLSTRPSSTVLKSLVAALRRRLDDFRPAELARVLQALAKLRLHPGEDVIRRIAARAGVRKPAAKPQ